MKLMAATRTGRGAEATNSREGHASYPKSATKARVHSKVRSLFAAWLPLILIWVRNASAVFLLDVLDLGAHSLEALFGGLLEDAKGAGFPSFKAGGEDKCLDSWILLVVEEIAQRVENVFLYRGNCPGSSDESG